MNRHTLQMAALHLMAVTMVVLCLFAAQVPGREVFYFFGGIFAVIALGTLKDMTEQTLAQLRAK